MSPDGRHRAVLFQRDCGATTGFSTQIAVLAADERWPGRGAAFVADDGGGEVALGVWGGPWAEMRWQSPDRLEVRYARGARVIEQRSAVGRVGISYAIVEAGR